MESHGTGGTHIESIWDIMMKIDHWYYDATNICFVNRPTDKDGESLLHGH